AAPSPIPANVMLAAVNAERAHGARRPWLFAITGGLVGAFCVAGIWHLSEHKEQSLLTARAAAGVSIEAPQTASSFSVDVKSDPPNAQLEWNGRPIGRTP